MENIPPQYTVAAGVASSDRERAVSVWSASGFGHPEREHQRAHYEWLYQRGPEGEGQVNFLFPARQSEPVGFLGVSLRRWLCDGQAAVAGVLVDFVVHPSHRSAAPALQLQRRGRERATEIAQLLFGLPEPKAVAVFKRLGCTLQSALPRYARVLRFGSFLRRRFPAWLAVPVGWVADRLDGLVLRLRLIGGGLRAGWQDGFDADFDSFWKRCAATGRCIGVRDRAFLEWRFGQQPGRRYRVLALRSRGDSTLQMYFVCERDGDTLVIKDLLVEKGGKVLAEGLAHLCLAARAAGASTISVQWLADESLVSTLRAAGFVQRESRPFFGMVGETLAGRARDKDWYITQADEDN